MRSIALLAVLFFAAPAAAQSFEDYAAPMRERARDDGWIVENVVDGIRTEERWCPRPDGCAADAPNVLVLQTYGLGQTITHRRLASDGWLVSAELGFWEANPPTFTLRASHGADAIVVGWELHSPELSDGTYYSRTGAEDATDFHAWLAAELPAYLESADAFRDRVVLRSETMRAHLRSVIASASVCSTPDDPGRFVCVPGPEAGGHGMFDRCIRRGLTPAEQAAFLATAGAELDERNRVARDHAAQFFPHLAALFL